MEAAVYPDTATIRKDDCMRTSTLAQALLLTSSLLALTGLQAQAAPETATKAPSPAATAPKDAGAAADDQDLLDTTCGYYLAALDHANPGKGASAEQLALAPEAQDDVFNAVLWAHGYLTGRAGSVAAAKPLTKAWIAEHVARLAEICRKNSSDGSMRLVDAAAKL
jgi:hypothetical protein